MKKPKKGFLVCLEMLVTYEDHADWYHFYTAHDKVYMDLNKAKERKAYIFNHLDEDTFNKAEGRCVGAWIKEVEIDET